MLELLHRDGRVRARTPLLVDWGQVFEILLIVGGDHLLNTVIDLVLSLLCVVVVLAAVGVLLLCMLVVVAVVAHSVGAGRPVLYRVSRLVLVPNRYILGELFTFVAVQILRCDVLG